jgi:hypothetical protein
MRPKVNCFEGGVDAGLGKGGHDGVAGGERVDAVSAECFGQAAAGVLHGRVVIHIDVAVGLGIGLDELVQRGDLGSGLKARMPAEVEGRSDGAEDDTDAIGCGHFSHGGVSSGARGPVFWATSLVPARMMTTAGLSWITSWWKRRTICGEVWPLMPRLM